METNFNYGRQGTTVKLNGEALQLNSNDELPVINGKLVEAGNIDLPATSITFITFKR